MLDLLENLSLRDLSLITDENLMELTRSVWILYHRRLSRIFDDSRRKNNEAYKFVWILYHRWLSRIFDNSVLFHLFIEFIQSGDYEHYLTMQIYFSSLALILFFRYPSKLIWLVKISSNLQWYILFVSVSTWDLFIYFSSSLSSKSLKIHFLVAISVLIKNNSQIFNALICSK